MENEINMESQPDKLNLLDNSSMEQQSLSPLERRVMDRHFDNWIMVVQQNLVGFHSLTGIRMMLMEVLEELTV